MALGTNCGRIRVLRRLPFAIKLGFALGLTILVAVGTVALFANWSASREFESYVARGIRPSLAQIVPDLAAHYEQNDGWQGAADILDAAVQPPGQGRGRLLSGRDARAGSGVALLLTDADGRLIYATGGADPKERISRRLLASGIPIQVQGATVGYLVPGSGQQEQLFMERLNRSLVGAGLVAAAVALGLGLALTRAVTRPLRVVRDGARRVASGDLSYRVDVDSRDEVGDLGAAFNEMSMALERDEELRRRMMADIAHELRTPVAVMRAQTEALQDGVFALTAENLQPIHAQTLLLGRLIDDLRDLALAEAGRLPMENAPVDLANLVVRMLGTFRSQAEAKDLMLVLEVDETLPQILGDAQRLEQMLGNLLSNAIRYTPPGGTITLAAHKVQGAVEISVSDSGPGISPEEMEHLFERFYRTDSARSRAAGGTGLGLAIAQQIADAHGGTLGLTSSVGKGSTFTARIPTWPKRAAGEAL
jgi:signal transduction histidine kinase